MTLQTHHLRRWQRALRQFWKRVPPGHAELRKLQGVDLAVLEDRILMSASPLPTAVVHAHDDASDAASASEQQSELQQFILATEPANPAALEPGEYRVHAQEAAQPADSLQVLRRELVVLDAGVHAYQPLLDDLLRQPAEQRHVDVVVLDPQRDGVEQLSELLAGFHDLDGLHLVTHGTTGQFKLGNTWLNAEGLPAYAGRIAQWSGALRPGGDMLIYGCDLAASESGRELVDALSQLTGADVAASRDLTGHAQYGGNWALEYQVGTIDAQAAFSHDLQQHWGELLAVITVDTTSDTVDSPDLSSPTALLSARGADGKISLREAILAANSTAEADEIIIPEGTFHLTRIGSVEDGGSTGDLDVTNPLTLRGAAAGQTRLDGNSADRVLHVFSSLTVKDVTLQNGQIDLGGGIRVETLGSVTLERVVLLNNRANQGGGIYNSATVNVTDVEFVGNRADFGSLSRDGGGLRNANGGVATLDRVLFTDNRADSGGGIHHSGSQMTVVNTTFDMNRAVSSGGGFFSNKTATLTNVTISENEASTGNGGGLFQTGGGNISLRNSILYNNTGGNSNTLVTSLGYNIDSGAAAFSPTTGDQQNVDPQLSALAGNGGFTRTRALNSSSTAIDGGTSNGAPSTDQRGYGRDAQPDIGAYEATLTTITVDTTSNTVDGDTASFRSLVADKGSDGRISLHEALLAANGNPDTLVIDTIQFAIPTGDAGHLYYKNDNLANSLSLVATTSQADAAITDFDPDYSGFSWYRILPSALLPAITGPVLIDGWTQAGSDVRPIIEISGALLNGSGDHGLRIQAAGVTVRGLNIHSFGGDGIAITDGGSQVLQGNYIGTDPSGLLDRGNSRGIYVGTSDNLIGGLTGSAANMISGNAGDGIFIANGASHNLVQGNLVGLSIDGNVLSNGDDGVEVQGNDNTIGGTTAAARNIISGNGANGLRLSGADATGNAIQGNYIGTNTAGTIAKGNASNGIWLLGGASNNTIGGTATGAGNVVSGNSDTGIEIQDSNSTGNLIAGNIVGLDASGTATLGNADGVIIEDAGNNTVGGPTSAARNIIAGNRQHGILVFGTAAAGNVLQGNYIGLGIDGSTTLANAGHGIAISDTGDTATLPKGGARNNTIGGTTAGTANVIAGNGGAGIDIRGGATGNLLYGNLIGTKADGLTAAGNALSGIAIGGSAQSNTIGGIGSGEANVIAHNGGAGVSVTGLATTGNAIRGNSVYGNAGSGIDLGTSGTTSNDLGDLDTGPNELQNFPVLSSVGAFGDNVRVVGTLESLGIRTYQIDFYVSSSIDTDTNGEGKDYLGSTSVTTDALGHAAFNLLLFDVAVEVGQKVTATATDSAGNTSEYGVNVSTVDANDAPVLDTTIDPVLQSVNEDAPAPSGAVGTLVAQLVDLVDGTGWNNVTDADSNSATGIALTAVDTTLGNWFYTLDGATWNSISGVAADNALLLAADANTRLYFRPAANYNGNITSAISFRAWDGTVGSNGSTADSTVNGYDTAFSTDIDTASIAVLPVNDASTISLPGPPRVYGQGNAPVQIEPAAVVTDIDSDDFDGGRLTIRFSQNGTTSDQLVIQDRGSGSGQIGISGSSLQYGNVEIGTVSGGSDGTPLVVTFNAAATAESVQAAARNVAFHNSSGLPSYLDRVVEFEVQDGDGGTATASTTVVFQDRVSLWLSTQDNVTNSGVPLSGWEAGDVLLLDGAPETFGAGTTSGTLKKLFSLRTDSGQTADLRAVHYVQSHLTVGSGANSFQLQPGDVIGSLDLGGVASATLVSTNSLTVGQYDVFVYRPDAAQDYSSGTLSLLLERPVDKEILALTLAERDILLGDTVVAAGTFLLVRAGGSDADSVYSYLPTEVGPGAPAASKTKLIKGADIGISASIEGLDLLGEDSWMGDSFLPAGRLLISVSADSTIAGVAATPYDVVSLEILTTVVGSSSTTANAALLLDGGQVGLNATAEIIDSLATGRGMNAAPTANTDDYVLDEGASLTVPAAGVLSNDTDPDNDGLTAVLVRGPAHAASFTFNSDGSFSYVHDGSENLSDDFVYEARDGRGGVDWTQVTLTMSPQNDDPTGTPPTAWAVAEDQWSAVSLASLQIQDPDATSGSLTLLLETNQGGLLRADAAHGVVISGRETGTLRLDGTLSQLNAFLAAEDLGYLSPPDANGLNIDSVQVTINDGGNSGAGGGSSISLGTIRVDATATNDDPFGAGQLPSALLATEDVLTPFGLRSLVLADSDAGSDPLELTLATASGTLWAATDPSLVVSGSGSSSVRVRGSLSALNSYLAGGDWFQYLGAQDRNGNDAATISVSVSDLGATGSGGGDPVGLGTIRVHLAAVNDDPVNLGSFPNTVSVIEDQWTSLDFSTLQLSDVDAGDGLLCITLTTSSGGTLAAATESGVLVIGSGTSVVQLQATVADLNTYLDTAANLRFRGGPNASGAGADSVTIAVSDQGNAGAGGGTHRVWGTVPVDITAVNDPPFNAGALPASIEAWEDVPTAVDLAAVHLADSDAQGESLTLKLRTSAGGTLAAQANGGVTVQGSGSSMLRLHGALDQLNRFLNDTARISYQSAPDQHGFSADTIELLLEDHGSTGIGGSHEVSLGTLAVNIAPTNDDPFNAGTLPAAQSAVEDAMSPLDLSSIRVSDVDAENHLMTMTVKTSRGGTLHVHNSGLAVTGSGTSIVTLHGTLGALNNWLASADGLSYLGPADVYGISADALRIYVSDNGHSGQGGGMPIHLGDVSLNIGAVNDSPFNAGSLPARAAAVEDRPSSLDLSDIILADVDASSGAVQLVLRATQGGTLSAVSVIGQAQVSGSGTSTLLLEGTLVQLNSFLASPGAVHYTGAIDAAGLAADRIQISLEDAGHPGEGSSGPTELGSMAVDIVPVNDAPILANLEPAPLLYIENAAPVPLTHTLAVQDVDHTTLSGATVRIASGWAADQERLFFVDQGGISGRWHADSGTLALVGEAPLATYQAALRSVHFANFSDDPAGGPRTLRITIYDPQGGSATIERQLLVQPVNDAPVARPELYLTLQNSPLIVNAGEGVLANDFDVDSAQIFTQLVAGPQHGTLVLQRNGSLVYVAAHGFYGIDRFTYQTSDGEAASQTVTVVIRVEPLPTPRPTEPEPSPPESSSGNQESRTNEEEANELPRVELAPQTGNRAQRDDLPNESAAPLRVQVEEVKHELQLASATTLQLGTPELDLASERLAANVGEHRSGPTQRESSMIDTGDVREASFLFDTAVLVQGLDDVQNSLTVNLDLPEWMAGTALFSSLGMSAGYILWSLRGGYMIASLLSAMPAWTLVDPLPVLEYLDRDDETDDESLQTMLEKPL